MHDPYANRPALKISVFMNVFNVHSNRSPIDGRVASLEYFPGSFVNADLDKASLLNERNAIVATRADGEQVTFVQVAGLIARRILCYVKVGDTLVSSVLDHAWMSTSLSRPGPGPASATRSTPHLRFWPSSKGV